MSSAPRSFSARSLFMAALSVPVVLGLFVLALRQPSPGELAQVHARVPELNGPGACALCHGAGPGAMAGACAACHERTAADVEAGRGLHGALSAELGHACGECHLDHNGGGFPLVSSLSFSLSGYDEREQYDHGGSGFALADHRPGLSCEECHANADVAHLQEGTTRFLGLSGACTTCHEDVHSGRLGADCGTCHGQQQSFGVVASFEHASFIAIGSHADSSCQDCHRAEGAFALETLFRDGEHPDERSCSDCHATPHTESFLDAIASRTGTTRSTSCEACHSPEHPRFDGQWDAMPHELHGASGIVLLAAHAEVACTDCHSGESFEDRFSGRAETSCATCHGDPHDGQFTVVDGGATAFEKKGVQGASCLDCHTRSRFQPSTFDVEAHGGTDFVLEGRHRSVGCAECHLRVERDLARSFRGTPQSCAACHADAHRSTFGGAECGECHVPTEFSDVSATAFEHGPRTGFDLAGAHAVLDCESCHERSPKPNRHGRRFGFSVLQGEESGERCGACHQDQHHGAFGGEDRPAVFQGRSDCHRCHTQESFEAPLQTSFDHGLWTGHALEGAHATLKCDECHAPQGESPAAGRSLGRVSELFGAGPATCALCHQDPHAGRFDVAGLPAIVEGTAGCARCHGSDSFAGDVRETFDHALWTGVGLTGDHVGVSCEDCHDPEARFESFTSASGPDVGRSCFDCHGDPHVGQFGREPLGAGRSSCARCHAPRGGLTFEHDTDSNFVLDESHRELECSSCHVPWPLADGSLAVRYKPLGTTCVECHGQGYGDGERNVR